MEMDVQPPVAFKFLAAAYSIPHPAKAHKGGEDAYFLAANSKIIGIADGVGTMFFPPLAYFPLFFFFFFVPFASRHVYLVCLQGVGKLMASIQVSTPAP
jgi:hypothetical protein